MKYLRVGDEGTSVEYLQLALSRAGYQLRTDGIFGERTCEALRDFLGESGQCSVDYEVWQRLLPYLKGYIRYKVEEGDTLARIAEANQSSVQAILTANPQIIPENLMVGQELVVPYDFALVPETVKYSSKLNEYVIEGLTQRYPFLYRGSIGKSVMGRDLLYLRIGEGEKQVFYSASYHANENITTPVLLKFAEEYARAYARSLSGVSDGTGGEPGLLYGVQSRMLYENFSLYLLPMVNPDGVDLVNGTLTNGMYFRNAQRIADSFPEIPFPSGWKANIDGIDLNLQFPAGWENARQIKFAQGYNRPAPRDYVGPAPLQAPESVAVYDFTRNHDFLLIIAYHTQGEVIYWKYLDYEPERSFEIAEYFGQVSGYAVEVTPGESGYAGYKDWFIQDYDRPGYTIEVGLGVNPLPMSQFDDIYEANSLILVGGMTQLLT